MRYVLLFVRFLAFVVLTLGCTLTVVIGRLLGQPHTFSLSVQQFWSRAMLWSWGVRTVLHGTPPNGGLIMANHQSYLDIWMIPRYAISVFVAKAEVRKMALVGWGASSVNTVYVDRNNKDSRSKTRDAIADRLRKGRSVIIFPEGTTHFGKEMLPLKPGMFYVAAEEGFPIIPVAIAYEDERLAWVGDEPIGKNFRRNFGRWSNTAHIHYGAPIVDTDPERMMHHVKTWIETERERMLAEARGR
jgi:1-acyl-sn-glycerol-3-phosphate acyltransferase